MAPYLLPLRPLFFEILSHETPDLWAQVLEPWLAQHRSILLPYEKFRTLGEWGRFSPISNDESWSLYALSRVSDLLLESLEPRGEESPAPLLSREQWSDFWAQLGVRIVPCALYHPFWCEIVAVEKEGDADALPQIEDVFWPALCFGDLLLTRAGVKVRAGQKEVHPEVAPKSLLYFAYSRLGRKTSDLSHGWGHNSQWRTSFRRDYLWHGHYIFNADGKPNFEERPFLESMPTHEWENLPPKMFFASAIGDDYGLSIEQREELLFNRCFVRSQLEEDDFWPYHDTAIMRQEKLPF